MNFGLPSLKSRPRYPVIGNIPLVSLEPEFTVTYSKDQYIPVYTGYSCKNYHNHGPKLIN